MVASDRLTYEKCWDRPASTPEQALLAVDGSGNESVLRHTGARAARQMPDALDPAPQDRVLDLDCGVCRIGRELARPGPELPCQRLQFRIQPSA